MEVVFWVEVAVLAAEAAEAALEEEEAAEEGPVALEEVADLDLEGVTPVELVATVEAAHLVVLVEAVLLADLAVPLVAVRAVHLAEATIKAYLGAAVLIEVLLYFQVVLIWEEEDLHHQGEAQVDVGQLVA